jgi:hypothetical protein
VNCDVPSLWMLLVIWWAVRGRLTQGRLGTLQSLRRRNFKLARRLVALRPLVRGCPCHPAIRTVVQAVRLPWVRRAVLLGRGRLLVLIPIGLLARPWLMLIGLPVAPALRLLVGQSGVRQLSVALVHSSVGRKKSCGNGVVVGWGRHDVAGIIGVDVRSWRAGWLLDGVQNGVAAARQHRVLCGRSLCR